MAAVSQKRRPSLLSFGEVLWDVLPSGPRLGGAPVNCAIHAHDLGVVAWIASARGNDELGRALEQQLHERGLPLACLQRTATLPTGIARVEFPVPSAPHYEIVQPAAWDAIRLTPELQELARTVDAFYFGTLAQRSEQSARTLHALLALTRRACIRFFDVNIRPPHFTAAAALASIAHATVLKLNDEELPVIAAACGAGTASARDFCAKLFQSYAVEIIVLTHGHKGATLVTREREFFVPSTRTRGPVVDTVGAGDAFSAGFLHSLLDGTSALEAAAAGSRLAARVCEVSGALLPPPSDKFTR